MTTYLLSKISFLLGDYAVRSAFENSILVYSHIFIIKFIYLHFVLGGELFDKIVELNSFSEKDAASLVQQIASIIAYLHSKDIVHRDLKPENLLFVDPNSNKLKLCDFGTAEIVVAGTVLQDAIGSPG